MTVLWAGGTFKAKSQSGAKSSGDTAAYSLGFIGQ